MRNKYFGLHSLSKRGKTLSRRLFTSSKNRQITDKTKLSQTTKIPTSQAKNLSGQKQTNVSAVATRRATEPKQVSNAAGAYGQAAPTSRVTVVPETPPVGHITLQPTISRAPSKPDQPE